MIKKFEDKILNPVFIILTILFWLITFFIFYQKEIKTRVTSLDNNGYQSIIPEDLLIEDDWKSIYFNEEKIGFSHTYLRLSSKERRAGYILENTTIINMPFGLLTTKINFHSVVNLSSRRELKNFKISLSSNKYSTKISGEMVAPKKLKITQQSSAGKKTYSLKVPGNLILSTFLEPAFRFKNLNVNKKIYFTLYNPILMKKQEVKMYVKDQRKTPEGEFFILKCNYQNLEYTLWVNQQGQVIKEISPLGIKLKKTTQTEAVKNLDKIFKRRRLSLRDKFSIPAKIEYSNVGKLTTLKVKLKNINPKILNLETSNQSIIKKNDDSVILKIIKKGAYKKPYDRLKQATQVGKYLKPTAYIQKDNPDIISLAKKITSDIGENNTLKKVEAILKWIKINITQLPTFSIPTSVDVLKAKVGDCNEITYLFAALTRACRIPTKIITGLVYLNQRFRYHMWAEVYINNQWITVDPTLNQFPVDVTHISLIQGGYNQQINLVNIISKMDIEIMGYKKDD